MIPEKEREALMRLTMCARDECSMCKYKDDCNSSFQYELATENMNILADALRTADRKTENLSEVPTVSDEPQTCSVNGRPYDCGNCEYHKCTADEPQKEPLPKTINGVKIADAVAWADKWLEDNPVSEMWDMIRTLRDATEWQDEPQTERSE